LTNASWTKTQTAAAADAATAPLGTLVGDTLESTDAAGDVAHFVRQARTVSATNWTLSTWAGPGEATWLWIRNGTIANGVAWFNLSTCAIGTVQAGITKAHAEANWAGDLPCRVGITFTGTVAAHDLDIGYSTADNTLTYDDGTDSDVDVKIWGVQLEGASTFPHTYVETAGSTVARNADTLTWLATTNVPAAGTYAADFWIPDHDVPSTERVISVGDSSNDEMYSQVIAAGDLIQSGGTVGGGGQWARSGGVDISDGVHRSVRTAYAVNNIAAWLDSTSIGTDTNATIPSFSGVQIRMGTSTTGANQLDGILTRVRFWNVGVSP
jgi:hypothetical protein